MTETAQSALGDEPSGPFDPDATRHSVRASENEIRAMARGELPDTLRAYAAECVLWFDGRAAEALQAQARKLRRA
jgi:hypothetical protein